MHNTIHILFICRYYSSNYIGVRIPLGILCTVFCSYKAGFRPKDYKKRIQQENCAYKRMIQSANMRLQQYVFAFHPFAWSVFWFLNRSKISKSLLKALIEAIMDNLSREI